MLASSPGESHRFHWVMRAPPTRTHPTPKSWMVEDGQAVLPIARNSWTTHLDGKPAPSVYMQALHGLLIRRHWECKGREFGLFCCFGNQNDLLQLHVTVDMFGLALWYSNIYKFSFFCQFVSQPSSFLSVQEGPLVSTRAIWKHFLLLSCQK